MKSVKKAMLFALAGTICVGATACGANPSSDDEESKTANIKAIICGYDNDWLKDNIQRFNALYKEEGYEVKLVLEDSDINSVYDVKNKRKNDTDLYFDYNKVNMLVDSSYSVMREEGVCLLEDLSDVFDSVALNSEKKEEGSKTIGEKMKSKNAALLNRCRYTGLSSSQEKYPGLYALPNATSTTGIYLNKKALTTLGYSMDDLLTTDALLDMCDEIVEGYDINEKDYLTKFFPIAYAGQNAGGYPGYMFDYYLAQYMGEEDYINFWKFNPKQGTVQENGYSVYEDPAILESLRIISELVNTDLTQAGYASATHGAAQGRVFTGTSNEGYKQGSLFMVSGDWMYKESEKDYEKYLNDVIAIKAPVISALGMKLGLCGKTHEVKVDDYQGRKDHCPECETKLREVVKLADEYNYEQKSNAEIARQTGVSEENVKRIRAARGYVIGGEGENVAFIPSYSNAKKVAKLFLRHLFSNDWQKIFEEKALVNSVLDMGETADVSSMNDRQRSLYEKTKGYNAKTLYPDKSNKLRMAIGGYFPATSTNLGVFFGLAYSHKHSAPQFTAETVYKNNKEYIKLNWQVYLKAAGL